MHKISRSPGLRLMGGGGGAYSATTHAIAGFRGKVPRKGREKRMEKGGAEKKVG